MTAAAHDIPRLFPTTNLFIGKANFAATGNALIVPYKLGHVLAFAWQQVLAVRDALFVGIELEWGGGWLGTDAIVIVVAAVDGAAGGGWN